MTQTFLSIGECMVEMAPKGTGDYQLGFAGDTLNTAWYAKHALGPGWDVAYFTAVGQDALSERMCSFMDTAGIRTNHIRKLPDRTVGLYLIELSNGERSFAYWRSDSAARQLAADRAALAKALGSAQVIFFSGITIAILSPAHRLTLLGSLSQARQNGATIVFDPNLRPRLWNTPETMRDAVIAAAKVSDIVMPSFDDDALAFGDKTLEATAQRYADAGVPLVVVKNGAGPMIALDKGKIEHFTPAPVSEIVDTTAAGDSFNAGFLASYLDSKDLPRALAAGAELAAKVITRHGALVDPEGLTSA
ncbi:Sugar kinase, ribokinase family [Hoeflea phototrophica DFL-43]|uniref:Sugar kinase, ribokinase family n=1 Tax=Hoeflea phototrophica (strain DSM 17068 / NCIMB 14078 / DFL-43) TaxID=411684 RepID=A9D2P0_HOEPD|nr:sugar kinase [Hoeflea phototrophica]EDQ34245.1 Sugar kinase, ribokinase family [Hoeflea phototrophica DFL-43]